MIRNFALGALVALTFGLTSLALGGNTASAEVIYNDRTEVVRFRDNPCEAGTAPIALTGTVHAVWYTTPDGTLKMNIQTHLTGTDANGIEYRVVAQQHMEHFEWPDMMPYTDRVRIHMVSKGSTVNALLVLTYDVPAGGPVLPVTSATACVG